MADRGCGTAVVRADAAARAVVGPAGASRSRCGRTGSGAWARDEGRAYAEVGAPDSAPRCENAADAGASRHRIASAFRCGRPRDSRHSTHASPCAAAHAVYPGATGARTRVDAARATRRADGTGP